MSVFRMNEWLRYYREIHEIGYQLSEGDDVPLGSRLSRDDKMELRKEQSIFISMCKQYLNACDIRMPPVAWKYNVDDKTTWISSPLFDAKNLKNIKERVKI